MSLSEFLEVFFLATTPIGELRVAIPDAINRLHISWYYAFPVAYAGNLLPVPFLLFLLGPASRIVSRVWLFERIMQWIFERSRRRGRMAERYGPIGLALFVAIPLPVTGAWTGSIVAFLLGMKFWRAFVAIAAGVFIAGIIMTILAEMALKVPPWTWGVFAGIILAALVVHRLRRRGRPEEARQSPPGSQVPADYTGDD
jgi:uncharacterized membrane protein